MSVHRSKNAPCLVSVLPTNDFCSKDFPNYEDWQAETPTIILDIPGIQAKDHHTDDEMRSLTLEALSVAYPSTTWARAYTDGSAEEAAKNGGGGVFIKLPDGRSIRKSIGTG